MTNAKTVFSAKDDQAKAEKRLDDFARPLGEDSIQYKK